MKSNNTKDKLFDRQQNHFQSIPLALSLSRSLVLLNAPFSYNTFRLFFFLSLNMMLFVVVVVVVVVVVFEQRTRTAPNTHTYTHTHTHTVELSHSKFSCPLVFFVEKEG